MLYNIFSFYCKHDISSASCIKIIEVLTKDDEERRYKRSILEQIYKNKYEDSKDISSKYILDRLTKAFDYDDEEDTANCYVTNCAPGTHKMVNRCNHERVSYNTSTECYRT